MVQGLDIEVEVEVQDDPNTHNPLGSGVGSGVGRESSGIDDTEVDYELLGYSVTYKGI